jgi:arabinogalactan oligomer/maltooligosaccharide transport system permease protein
MAALVVAPFAVGAAVSLFDHTQGRFTFVGLANFLDILLARDWPITSPLSFYLTLGVTVLWTACNVALHVTLGVALALLLRDPWLRLRGLYRVILIIPWAIPNYITALIWKGMFQKQFGAVNAILGLFGVEPISWFSRFSTAFAANLTTNTWLGFPFMMVVTLGALQAIPRDLEQAAEVDGATGWQRFRHVTLPLLTPALLPAVVLGSVWTFNMFNIIYLVSGGEPDGASEILISEAYRWAFTRGHRYGYAAAYAVLVFGVLLVWSRASDRLVARVRG